MIAREQRTVAGSGERLDRHLLNAYPWLDRATAEDLVASGRVRLNGRPAKKGAKLAAGDGPRIAHGAAAGRDMRLAHVLRGGSDLLLRYVRDRA